MKSTLDAGRRALRRLLANGRLTMLPKHPADQLLVATLAASRIEAGKAFTEQEVNDRLIEFLEGMPFGIDHVTLRRLLVDSRLIVRTTTGSTYLVNPAKVAEIKAASEIDPAQVVAEVAEERERRKRQHAA
jgi:hypothetical protein